MTQKQINNEGLTQAGWRRLDMMIKNSCREDRMIMLIKIASHLPENNIEIKINGLK